MYPCAVSDDQFLTSVYCQRESLNQPRAGPKGKIPNLSGRKAEGDQQGTTEDSLLVPPLTLKVTVTTWGVGAMVVIGWHGL